MALMRDSLWNIVNETEAAPSEDQANIQRKYMVRRDDAFMIIVLAVDPSLLYLGDPKRIHKLSEQT